MNHSVHIKDKNHILCDSKSGKKGIETCPIAHLEQLKHSMECTARFDQVTISAETLSALQDDATILKNCW